MTSSSNYHRLPSYGQLPASHGGASGGGSCRSRALRAMRSSLPLLLACLLSSSLTYAVVIYTMQTRAPPGHGLPAGSPADGLPGGAALRGLPGGGAVGAGRFAAGEQQQQQQQQGQGGSAAAAAAAVAAARVAATTQRQQGAAAAQQKAADAAAPNPQQLPAPARTPLHEPADAAAPAPAASAADAAAAEAAANAAALAAFGRSGRMTVAIVNHAPYHLEIVAGWLHVLSQLPTEVIWYQAGQASPAGSYSPQLLLEIQGFRDIMGGVRYMMVPTTSRAVRVDFAVFISPEYFEKETKAFLDAAMPISSVMLAHNGGNVAVQRVSALAPRTHVAGLAPHVAGAVRRELGVDADWAMAVLPFEPKYAHPPNRAQEPCSLSSVDAISCLHGFSIQGNFEPARRNYTRVWSMLRDHAARGELPTRHPLPPLHLHLVGRGAVEHLGLPAEVAPLTTVHFNEKYPDYYERIHHTNALLLVLGSSAYVTSKMSSTLVSSLITGTPVVADDALLAAYTEDFLPRDAAFVMRPGEDEVDAMLRVLRKSPAEIYRVHRRVREHAAALNARTAQLLTSRWMPLQSEVANRHAALHVPYAPPGQTR
ncbi:hypothetical protein Rsub_08390 [Raphidocelis subcapitata]|uniref:Uncharacterized protein n=1 Tax=Raphidocelis subcapitata TaxID=307507 RepID=A0A2V0P6E2_9CHLO|nr:hypothetical protein Rsub_08390 [Raphidocelis subcapitata]|eukprot:GBF95428.1 hypothetical protein Rsub_08390 [Raphidocelis subcapitata]